MKYPSLHVSPVLVEAGGPGSGFMLAVRLLATREAERRRGGEEEGRAGISRQVGALISPADPAFQHEYWSGQYTLLAVRSRQSLRQAQLSQAGFPSLTFTFTRLCGGELTSDI